MALEDARHNVNAIVPGIIDPEAFRIGNLKMNERIEQSNRVQKSRKAGRYS